MRRLTLIALLPLLALGCATPPCEELGERLCACTGLSTDSCKTQVQDQLKNVHPGDAVCEKYLATCNAPANAEFCEWLGSASGKLRCGIAQ